MTVVTEKNDIVDNFSNGLENNVLKKGKFMIKFSIFHTLSYLVVGMLSFYIFNYGDIFEKSESLSLLMRPLDSPVVQMAIIFQLARGLILAVPFVPYRSIFIKDNRGWFKIWAFMFILTCIGAVITGPGSIEGMIYTNLPINDHIGLGYIEVFLQTLLFSFLLWKTENKKLKIVKNDT